RIDVQLDAHDVAAERIIVFMSVGAGRAMAAVIRVLVMVEDMFLIQFVFVAARESHRFILGSQAEGDNGMESPLSASDGAKRHPLAAADCAANASSGTRLRSAPTLRRRRRADGNRCGRLVLC